MEENVTVPETPEVVKHTDAEWYRDVSLEDAEVFIRSNLQSAVRSVIATGFYLKHIRDNELYLEAGYKNINEYAMDRFGLSASATSRYITRNTRFSRGGNSPLIDDRFKDFSKSQLQEMLGMSDEQLEQITPDMTVREIRSMARPKEIPYIEIPGQTELKDIPGVMPEPSGRREMAATDLFQDEEVLPGIEEPEELPGETHEVAVTELLGEETEPVETEDTSAGEIATSQQETPMSDYGFREKQCNALARRLIQAWKPWFLQDFQHRVMNVVESEKQIKEKIKGSSRTWFFKGDTGKIMHANLFDGYIQFWEDACLGNCEWFYLCAAIQRMWNVIALEDAQKISDDLNAANCTPDVTSNAAEKQQMGHCLHRPEYECSLPEEYMHRPGSGMDCAHECCWECAIHGTCKLECNSSANRPEVEEGQHWPKTCITGKSKYGNCNCCGANGVKCCAECKEDCNCRCGWLDETEEEIATSQMDIEAPENEVKERTDIELLRELLERKKQLLAKCLEAPGIDKSDEHIRMQKLEVGALASMLCELEDLKEKKDRPKQPELPQLKNNDQRAAFIDTYETWPLWIDNQETGERYYRYDLPDGTSFVIKTYHSMLYDWKADVTMRYKEGYGANEEYLLEPGKFFRDCRANRTTLIEKLKEIQKGERQ